MAKKGKQKKRKMSPRHNWAIQGKIPDTIVTDFAVLLVRQRKHSSDIFVQLDMALWNLGYRLCCEQRGIQGTVLSIRLRTPEEDQ